MKLIVTTPLETLVRADDVVHVRAEDATGSFGIKSHHTPLVTALAVSVVSWRDGRGEELHCAVRSGVLSIADDTVSIAVPEGVVDRDLGRLEHEVLARYRRALDVAATARVDEERLRVAAIRTIQRLVRPRRSGPSVGGQ